MDAASYSFILFGVAAAILSNFSKSPAWRSTVLGLASVVFLALLAHHPLVFVPLAVFLLLGYVCLRSLEQGWLRSTTFCVVTVILVYIWLKKYTVLPESSFLHFPYFTLGLSYIFFRVLHLIIETGDNRESGRIGLGTYLLYTLNFTTFVSGPIQRYDAFARDQFAEEPIPLGVRVVGRQLERIVRGFFKVNVLAMFINMAQLNALAQLTEPASMPVRGLAAFELCVLYPFFLYANFSGYIDIVIALARLMRVELPENFDRPFSSTSFLDFWNRWHITLSTWLKTYVYNPLLMALMRRFPSRSMAPFWGVLCFFITFFLIGVWHGRTSVFIVFGVLQGAGVALNKLWQLGMAQAFGKKGYRAIAAHPVYEAFARGLTFSWFAFTLFWFWGDWAEIGEIFHALSPLEWGVVWLAIWLMATAVLALWEWLRVVLLSLRYSEGPILVSRYARVVYTSALVLLAVGATTLFNQPAPDIVYKSF